MSKKAISLAELSGYLNSYLDPMKIDESAYNGVQVANQGPIYKIATAVTASQETIDKAIAIGAQALIAHHGLFRKKDAHPIVGTSYTRIKALIDNDIALLGYHLPLDAHREVGNNWKAAYDLGLKNLRPIAEFGGQFMGVIGEIEETPFDDFVKKITSYYGHMIGLVKVKKTIKTVAIISGGAEKYTIQAAQEGADCFITGCVDEPVWDMAHENNISFIGLGHYTSEIIGPKTLADHLHNKFGIPCEFIKTDNPF